MDSKVNACATNTSDKSVVDNNHANGGTDVPEKTSRDVVLEFMEEHRIPLRPMEIYGGLIENQTINFGYRTTQNKVKELYEAGLLKRVEIDDDEGVVRTLPDEGDYRAYYLITEEGIEAVRDE